MSKNTKTQSQTHITVTTPISNPTCTPPSIRSICRRMILAGAKTSEIAAEITKFHPTSAAARIPAKHIAWYKATMKKAGELSA